MPLSPAYSVPKAAGEIFHLVAVWLSLCAAGLALDNSKPLAHYGRQTWQTESGLPQNTVHSIIQTFEGYIWFATEGGAVRFDGVKFVVFDSQNTTAIRSNNIRSLLEDREHNLWISTAEGLTRFRGKDSQLFTTAQGLPSNSVWSTYQDRSGRLWAVTSEGLALFHDGTFKPYTVNGGTPVSSGGIVEDSSGTLWIGTPDGVRCFIDGKFQAPAIGANLATTPIEALLADQAGRIWLGTARGLFENSNGTLRKYSVEDGLPAERIISLYEDRAGDVWISTDAGVARLSEGKIERFPANDPLSNDTVLCMFEDREGSMWFGSESAGISILRDEKFTTYTSKDGLSDDLVHCVYQDRHGVLWTGTNAGLDRRDDAGFAHLTTVNGLSSNLIFALAEDAASRLLAGTPDGLNVLDGSKIQVVTSGDGLADDFVRSLYSDTDGSVWIGTRRGLTHWTKGTFKTYTTADGLASDFVGALLRDRQGALWIGTQAGLTQYKDGQFNSLTTRDGLSSNVITALFEERAGVLLVGTQDGGLTRLENGKVVRYPASAGLPSAIYGILAGSMDDLWLTSNSGIFRLRGQSRAAAQYSTADGLRVNECSEGHPSAWRTKDGSLWFATLRGLSTIDAHSVLQQTPAPPVVIENVLVDNREIDATQTQSFAPGSERLSFEYAGLSYISPQRTRYRFKLEGFDKDWIDAGTRRTAYYTNLAPASYRFVVSARTNDGDWSTEDASFAFRLRPHFYQTYWFGLLLVALLALAGYGIYRLRLQQVEAQFNAVLAERNRIAREIHDTLAQGFVAVSLQLELASRKLEQSPEAAKKLLLQAREMVVNSLNEARQTIWELRSQSAQSSDLPSLVSKMATAVTERSNVKVRFQVNGTNRPLPAHIEAELLRIGQEAVTNVVRHANATNLNIDLKYDSKKVSLTVADDGRGFVGAPNSTGPDGHFGLKGMRERAQQIGAKLEVVSTPGTGTRIMVEKEVS